MTQTQHRNTSLLTDVKLAGASALATTLFAIFVPGSPLWAAELVFSSAADAPSGENGDGEQQVSSGIVQLKLDDGTMVSIMGPARYSLSPDGQLSVASGSFTASAPASGAPRPIVAGNGSQITLKPGSSASGKIAADGSFSGFALRFSRPSATRPSSLPTPARPRRPRSALPAYRRPRLSCRAHCRRRRRRPSSRHWCRPRQGRLIRP